MQFYCDAATRVFEGSAPLADSGRGVTIATLPIGADPFSLVDPLKSRRPSDWLYCVHEVVRLRSSRMSARERVHFGVEVVEAAQENRFRRHRHDRAAEIELPVMAQDHVLDPQEQFRGKGSPVSASAYRTFSVTI